MRKELKEYNYDWMIWSLFDAASKTMDGTEKEFRQLLNFIPAFRGVLEPIKAQGVVGIEFCKLAANYLNNIITAHEKGKKRAITTFCFNPAIMYAMDVVPITLEVMTVMGTLAWDRGTSEYLDYACEVGFTETSCSSQRGSLGAYLAGLGEKIDFVVCDTPGVCDTNANSYAFASAYLNLPFYSLNYPPTLTGERTSRYHREDYKGLIAFIEEQTGKKLDLDRLREVLMEIKKQDEIICEIEELQRFVPSPKPPIFGLFTYACRFMFAGMKECTRLLELMLEKVRENADNGICGLASGRERTRALFCYIDHYTADFRFFDMLDRSGITSFGSMLSTFWQKNAPYSRGRENETYHIDTTELDAMIDSIAEANSRMPMIKQIRGPYDKPEMWLEDTLAAAKVYNADCIIYNGTPGCRNTWGMVKVLAQDTEKRGYPTHIMYSDAFDDRVESWETTSARLEEFFKVRRLLK
ncbi:MAG: 2-hydroxyacyl-CoA dehydratase subunit D [Bacillota bacterium]